MGIFTEIGATTGADGQPDAALVGLAAPGYVVDIRDSGGADWRRIEMVVHPETAPVHHVVLRIDLSSGREPALACGFAAEVRPVCLTEHVSAQDSVVEAAAAVLGQLEESHMTARLAGELRSCWADARTRLGRRQEELLSNDRFAQKVELCAVHGSYIPVLAARRTRLALGRYEKRADDRLDAAYIAGGKVEIRTCSAADLAPVTKEALLRITSLTGHEKLKVLAGSTDGIARLRDAFLQGPLAHPGSNRGWMAWDDYSRTFRTRSSYRREVEVYRADGVRGRIEAFDPRAAALSQEAPVHLVIEAHGAKRGQKIRVEMGGHGKRSVRAPIIGRRKGGKTGFSSAGDLDAMLRLAIEMLIVADPMEDYRHAPSGVKGLTPEEVRTHPLLNGLDPRPELVALFGVILATPYQNARGRARSAGARAVARTAERERMDVVADELADGALIGSLDLTLRPNGEPGTVITTCRNSTRLGIIRSKRSGTTGRRRRYVAPIHEISDEMPATGRILAKHPPILKTNALRTIHDAFAGCERRDFFETAARFATRLAGGAENPLLTGAVRLRSTPLERNIVLRETVMDGEHGISARAVAIAGPGGGGGWPPYFTGVGFVVTITPDGAEHYLRPARINEILCLPLAHKAPIASAVRKGLLWRAPAALRALDVLWSRGPHSEACTL